MAKNKVKSTNKEVVNPHAIIGFEIKELFGYLDYKLLGESLECKDLARLTILYGLNGTGKTTILKLAYHLLSPHMRKGHKSVLARTAFKKFGVILLDGTTVWAERKTANIGSFILYVERPKHKPISHNFVAVDEPPSIPADRKEGPSFYRVMETLRDIASSIFYIADDRSVNIEIHEVSGIRTFFDTQYFESYLERARHFREVRDAEEAAVAVVVALQAATLSLHQLFSVQVNRLSSTGFASAHSIYSQVIKQLAIPSKKGPKPKKESLDKKISKLMELASESKTFQKYGLSTELDTKPFILTYKKVKPEKKYIFGGILTAYLEALEDRFKELRSIYKTIDNLIIYLNMFLRPKVAKFHLDDGLKLLAPNGEILAPRMLSSGERHLLLILCFTLLSSNQRALFIVDEPEISLNISWQRKLLDALLSIGESSEVQFLMASHSVPLITPYRKNVIKLEYKKRKYKADV